MTSDPFTATFTDKYASTLEGIGAFFGNRSLVFHYANKTRISCANFKKVQGGSGDGSKPITDDCSSSTTAASSTLPTSAPVTTPPTMPTNATGTPTPRTSLPVTAGAALPGVATAAGAVGLLVAVAFGV